MKRCVLLALVLAGCVSPRVPQPPPLPPLPPRSTVQLRPAWGPAAPLALEVAGTNVLVTWPRSATNAFLFTTPCLGRPWDQIARAAAVGDSFVHVAAAQTAQAAFYRLSENFTVTLSWEYDGDLACDTFTVLFGNQSRTYTGFQIVPRVAQTSQVATLTNVFRAGMPWYFTVAAAAEGAVSEQANEVSVLPYIFP